ncbi:hypothetical protein ACFFVB_18505 [Formosa undariae]|uniref:Uncharacterized protein n=1 Tax=Formosa undariae TaxID=1325436 RepID=A0ABV5F6S2_9FLAO
MITLDIPERNLNMYLPECLAECDSEQYINMCNLIAKYNAHKIDLEAFKIKAVYKLLNLKPTKNITEAHEEEKNANIYALSQLIESYFETIEEDGAKEKRIKLNFIHNPIPTIAPLWCTFYGPSDAFKNVTEGEYSDALNFFMEFNKTKEPELLYFLMAVFYRKKRAFHWLKKRLPNYNGDVRERYNEHKIEDRVKEIKLLPDGYAYGFYLLFASFHEYLTNSEITLNGEQIRIGMLFDEPTEKQISSGMPGIGLKSIEYQISESGVFGSNTEVRETNLWEILIRLYDITKTHQDEKARAKAAEAKSKSKTK